MGRIRTIKPEFPQNEKVGKLSREARLLYILLWTIADDAGRARAASRLLVGHLYPYDTDITIERITNWLDELEMGHCIRQYKVKGASYLEIHDWLDHQKIDRPSKSRLPQFAEASPRPLRAIGEASATDLNPGPVPRTLDLNRASEASTKPREPSPKKALPPPAKQAAAKKDQKNGQGVKGVKREEIPRQGAVSADKKFIYFRKGTMEFEAYSQDYQDALGEMPNATEHGRWFKITGEKVA